ncbi:hypothetical protein HDU98_000245 [Podochytrium sp. JEL0797]|nr:hypothetical protein HDU98_000245 [Podochytrium sp. JEL0797]
MLNSMLKHMATPSPAPVQGPAALPGAEVGADAATQQEAAPGASLLSRALSLTRGSPAPPLSATHRKMSAPEPSLSDLPLQSRAAHLESLGIHRSKSLAQKALELNALMDDLTVFQMQTSLDQRHELEREEMRKLHKLKKRMLIEDEKEKKRVLELREKTYRKAFAVGLVANASTNKSFGSAWKDWR